MKKVFSIVFSILLLASHMYLTIGTHYCGGEAVEKKFVLGKAGIDCGMSDMHGGCNHPETGEESSSHLETAPCCENDYQTLEPTDEFIKEFNKTLFHVDFAIAFLYRFQWQDLLQKPTQNLYADYFPPWFEKDIQSLFQTFLN